ncbi:MAG: hypothetical protein JXJ04_01320 [Spirochaetales bacterium]|nr:hypothetical protein [Spirochaetales bacterium]
MMKIIAIVLIILIFNILPVIGEGYPLQTPAGEVISEVRTYNWTGAKGWFAGQVTRIIRETYDEEGRLAAIEVYYSDMVPAEKTVFTYKNNMIKKTTRNHDNVLIRNALVQEEGDTITETVLRGDGSLFYKTIALLGRDGEVTELNYYNNDEQLVYQKVFTYSPAGDVTVINLYNPDNSLAVVIDIVYEKFDDSGNWISRSEYYTYSDVWGRPRDSVQRKINYGGDDHEE